MNRLVKDFIEVQDYTTLDQLIESLVAARDSLANPAEAEVRMKGDDVFGRRISISFFREQTAEEAECDARYASAYRESRQLEQARLQDELGVCSGTDGRSRRLRIVA